MQGGRVCFAASEKWRGRGGGGAAPAPAAWARRFFALRPIYASKVAIASGDGAKRARLDMPGSASVMAGGNMRANSTINTPLRAPLPRFGGALPAALVAVIGAGALAGCTTVTLQGGDKPIEVNLNVKIDQEVRVKLDREIEDLIAENPDIF